MKSLGAFFSTVFYNHKALNVSIAVVDADRIFGFLGCDILNHSKESIDRCFKAEVSERLPKLKGVKTSINLTRKVPLRCHLNGKSINPLMNYCCWDFLNRLVV